MNRGLGEKKRPEKDSNNHCSWVDRQHDIFYRDVCRHKRTVI